MLSWWLCCQILLQEKLVVAPLWVQSIDRNRWTWGTSCDAAGANWKLRSLPCPIMVSVFGWSKRFWQWESIVAISWCEQALSGVSRDSVDTRFWDRHSYNPSPSDVILRTGCIVECNDFISQHLLFYTPLIAAGQSNGCPMVPGSQRHSCSFQPQLRDGHKVIAHQVRNGTKFNHYVIHSRFHFWDAIQFKRTWNRDVYCDWLVKKLSVA